MGKTLLRLSLPLLLAAAACAKKTPALPSPVAESVSGNVQYLESERRDWTPLKPGMELALGSRVMTSGNGYAVLRFHEGTLVRLTRRSEFIHEGQSPALINVRLKMGLLEAWVAKARAREFRTVTPTAVAAVRGTRFRAEVDERGSTTVDLFDGAVSVSDVSGKSRDLRPGQRCPVNVGTGFADMGLTPPGITMDMVPPIKLKAPKADLPKNMATGQKLDMPKGDLEMPSMDEPAESE